MLNLFCLPAGRLSFKCFEINLEESKPFSVWKNKVGEKKPMVKVCAKKEIPKGACVLEKGIRAHIKGARIAPIRLKNSGEPDRDAVHGVGWICGLSSSRCPRRPISRQSVQRFPHGTHREGERHSVLMSGSHGPTCDHN